MKCTTTFLVGGALFFLVIFTLMFLAEDNTCLDVIIEKSLIFQEEIDIAPDDYNDEKYFPRDAYKAPMIMYVEHDKEVNTCERDNPIIALTFDDGPSSKNTPKLLDALAELDVKATFFIIGSNIKTNEELIRRMYNEGHAIGNHSYSHIQLTRTDYSQIEYQVLETNRMLEEITGEKVTLFRPPYGSYDDKVIEIIEDNNMAIVLWSIDPRDWDNSNPELVSDHIVERAVSGSIVLLHDIHMTSIDAAIAVIQTLIEKGFCFATVEELLGEYEPGAVYNKAIINWSNQ